MRRALACLGAMFVASAGGCAHPAAASAQPGRGTVQELLVAAQAAALERLAADADVETALMARVVRDWAGGRGGEYEQALAYLNSVGQRVARTALRVPRIDGIEAYLTVHFGDRVTELLALCLLEETNGAGRKVFGVLFSLQRHGDPATTGALLRFAIETRADDQRRHALQSAQAMADPALATKLAYEVARARRLDRPVPQAVLDLPTRAP